MILSRVVRGRPVTHAPTRTAERPGPAVPLEPSTMVARARSDRLVRTVYLLADPARIEVYPVRKPRAQLTITASAGVATTPALEVGDRGFSRSRRAHCILLQDA